MAFFEELGRRVYDVTGSLSGKAKDFSEQLKLEGEIRNAENDKRDLFLTIGRMFYEEQTDPEAEKPDYQVLVDQIRALSERADKAQARIKEIKEEAKAREEERIARREAERAAEREAAEAALALAQAEDPDDGEDPEGAEDGDFTPIPEAEVMMICPNCRAAVPEGSVFCPKCGSKIEVKPAAKAEPRICPKCGSTVSEDALFCGKCGQSLHDV